MNWNRLGGLAFFAIALAGTTAAQAAPMSCVLNGGVPSNARSEGTAELAGDFVLNCSGGTPTAAGADVPRYNVQVFLNTNVTSRIVAGDAWSEALLMIDEPIPGAQRYCSPTEAAPCTATGVGDGDPGLDGPDGVDYNQADGTVANIYQGRRTAANVITFFGVPIDPPGPYATRAIHVTNLRANANQLNSPGSLIPSQIVAFVSAPGLDIPNPQTTIGFVIPGPGQNFSATKLVSSFLQCNTFNRAAATTPGAPLSEGLTSVVKFSETFYSASAFRKRTTASGGADSVPAPADQNVPGFFATSESGFYNSAAPATNGLNKAGLADHGTRLVARFTNIPEGMQLYATLYPVKTCPTCGPNGGPAITNYITTPPFGFSERFARLVTNASGPFAAAPGTNAFRWGAALENEAANGVAAIPVVNGAAVAVWEVTGETFFTPDSFEFGIGVAYKNLPGTGTALVTGGFGPTGTTTGVPRFAVNGTTVELFTAQRGSSECRVNP